jgi:hypothetical protein
MTFEKVALTAEILVSYVVVRRRLWRTEFPQALAAIRRTEARVVAVGDPARTGVRLGRATSRVLRLLPTDSRCLMRSLVVVRLLARRGIEARLVLGVSGPGDFVAHAWVEQSGVPLLPTGGDAFRRLVEL